MTAVHIEIKLKGKETGQQLFHDLARYLDIDWPYGGGLSRTGQKKSYKSCDKCKGMVYCNPILNEQDLRALARQCNVGVRVKRWKPFDSSIDEEKCK